MKLRRIFALAPDCHVPGSRYGVVWRNHFYDGLRDSGLEVIFPTGLNFSWARPAHSASAEITAEGRITSRALAGQIERAMETGIDAVISYCFSHDIELELVDRVRAAGVPWINFFCDSAYAFHTVEAIARRTSLNWFVETAAEDNYRALGVPYLCAPYAVNPRALPDASCQTPDRTLSFVGTANKPRIKAVALLRLMGTDVHVAGRNWPRALAWQSSAGSGARGALKRALRFAAGTAMRGHVREHLHDDEFLEYLRGTQTLLGLNEGGLGKGPYVSYLKLRDIEFPGHGCCYLAQHNDDIERAFEIGREVYTYRTLWEGRRLARKLARDPDGCRRMGERARERVLAEHTWRARLPQLMDSLV